MPHPRVSVIATHRTAHGLPPIAPSLITECPMSPVRVSSRAAPAARRVRSAASPVWPLPRLLPALLPFLLLAVLLQVPTAQAAAQADSSATVRGSVRIASGLPVEDVLVRITHAGDSCAAATSRTLANGTFTLPKLQPGAYTLSVRRLGYETLEAALQVSDGVNRYEAVLTPMPALLNYAQLADGWMGVVGLVGDNSTMDALAGATVTRMGGGEPVTTDAAGRFVLPIESPGTGALRVEREGFAPRLVSYSIDDGGRSPAVVVLDSGSTGKEWASVWTDLNQRAKWSTPRTARVGRDELALAGSGNLLQALERSPSIKEAGVIVSRLACVFVDGLPRPGYPVDAIRTDRVEYVEAYPVRTDLSRTLVNRWPPGAVCGAAAGGDIVNRRALESGNGAYYVVVWTR